MIEELPSDWNTKTIGDVADIRYGKSKPVEDGLVPVIGSSGEYAKTNRATVEFPTLIVGRKGNAGKTWLSKTPCYPSDTTFYLKWKSEIDIDFLYYQMNLRPLSGQHAKTTMPSLQKQDLEKYLLAYPPLSEQRKIAHVLRTIQASKEKTEAVIGSLKELKKSMMRHLFTYGPVPVGEIGKVKLKQTEIGGMPEEWEAKPIGEIVDEMRYGLSIRSEPKEKYPNLGMNHLKDGKIEVSEIKYVNLEDKLYNKFKVEKGDILFNRTNSAELVGKTAIFDLDYDCVFASYLIRVRVKKDRLIPDYLNHYLNMPSIQQRIKTLASRGVSQSNISATRLSSFQIPLPSIAVQNQICKIIATLDTRIKPEQSKKEALDELFKSTLQNLMTGKVRVNHLEIGD